MANVAYSADIEDMRGTIGDQVYSRVRSGATVRARVSVRNPQTPAQVAARHNLAAASVAYKNLSLPLLGAWAAYANTQTRHNSMDGSAYTPTANTVFCGLASKFLQINPTGTIPVTPPAAAFTGDTLTAAAYGGIGYVTFTADAPNSGGVTTELLLQPLKSRARRPYMRDYRTQAFVVFSAGAALTYRVAVPSGVYAPAYRFVNPLTGQETGLVTLPVVEVG